MTAAVFDIFTKKTLAANEETAEPQAAGQTKKLDCTLGEVLNFLRAQLKQPDKAMLAGVEALIKNHYLSQKEAENAVLLLRLLKLGQQTVLATENTIKALEQGGNHGSTT